MKDLSKYELNNYENLKKVSLAIGTIYKNLANLEKNKQRNTTKYEKNLNYLMIALEVERDIYSKILGNSMLINKIYDDINKTKNLAEVDANFDYVYLLENDKALIRIKEIISKVIYKENSFDEISILSDLYNVLNFEVLTNFLIENEKKLENYLPKEQKDLLIEFKYNLAFVNQKFEKELLKTKFKGVEQCDSRLGALETGFNYHEYLNERRMYIVDILIDDIGNFNTYNDFDLLLAQNCSKRMLVANYIFANIKLLNSDSIVEIKSFLSEISEEELLSFDTKEFVISLSNFLVKHAKELESKNKNIKKMEKRINKNY